MNRNLAQPKTDDFTFFVLRSKASTFENAAAYEDTFCVVHDSYADRIALRRSSVAERICPRNGSNLSSQSALWNTSEEQNDNNHGSHIKAVFNLKLFRDYLTCFEVHPTSSISYIDNTHTVCSVQTETEFLELWKFAKSCAKRNKGVLLLVNDTNNQDDNMINSDSKISTVNNQKSLNTENANLPENYQLEENTFEVNYSRPQSFNKPFDRRNNDDNFTPVVNLTTSSSRILAKENSDIKLGSTVHFNINRQDFRNKAPPTWFVQYMEQFKQGIIKEVLDQVMVNVKKNLNECPMKSPDHEQFEDAVRSENHHQMLDKAKFTSKTCCCGCDTENVSLSSDLSNEEDSAAEWNFEMVQKPSNKEKNTKDKNMKDLSSFDFLPEMSLSEPSQICMNKDHFTANSNNIPTFLENSGLNIPTFSKFNDKESSVLDDVDTKIHSTYSFDVSDKCQNISMNDFTNSISKKLIENSSKLKHKEINTESECLNANNLKTDVNDSHTSYMTTKPINTIYSDSPIMQHIYQPPMDSNDLPLSFHSHTTSIADNGFHLIRKTNSTSSHDYSKRSLSNSRQPTNSKENNTCKQTKTVISNKNLDNTLLKEKSNTKNAKHVKKYTAANSMPGTAEPVHILPETLVTGAVHVASLAYGTAREAIVKLRPNSRPARRLTGDQRTVSGRILGK